MPAWLRTALFAASFCSMSGPSLSQDCPSSLRLGYYANWYPYVEVFGKRVTGQDVEAIRQWTTALGIELSLELVPESRALLRLQQGELDLILGASKTPERSAYAWFSQPYRREVNTILVQRDLWRRMPQISTLNGFLMYGGHKLIGTFNPVGYYGERFANFVQQPVVKQRSLFALEEQRRFELVRSGRAGYTVVDRTAMQARLEHDPSLQSLAMLPFNLNEADVHLMLSKKTVSERCVALFDQLIASRR